MTYRFYGSKELPPLPWYDKEITPYALIYNHEDQDMIVAFCSSARFSVSSTSVLYESNTQYYAFILNDTSTDWSSATMSSATGKLCNIEDLIWSNEDIYYKNSNATVAFAGSDPVPARKYNRKAFLTLLAAQLLGGIEND